MQGVILVILYKRQDYTEQVLRALAAQPEINQFHVHFQIDSCIKEVVDQAVAWNVSEKSIVINGQQFGCGPNVYAGLNNAFAMGEFVIVVEDDTVPSHDFLKYMLWAKPLINDDCRSISAYHKNEGCTPDRYNVVHHAPRMCAWGWATTRKHWLAAQQVWDWSATGLSWDLMIAYNYFWQRKTVMPYLSRCKNIGAENGTYTLDAAQHERDVAITKWANTEDWVGEYVFEEGIKPDEVEMWKESENFLYRDLKQG